MAYEHPYETHQNNLHHAMDYNAAGQPVIRVINSQATANADGRVDAFGSIDWEELF